MTAKKLQSPYSSPYMVEEGSRLANTKVSCRKKSLARAEVAAESTLDLDLDTWYFDRSAHVALFMNSPHQSAPSYFIPSLSEQVSSNQKSLNI